uniref:Neuritin 1 n=1 Tax=Lynx canadensis TaxID=61383 RepID=A0A667J098_LYNCA
VERQIYFTDPRGANSPNSADQRYWRPSWPPACFWPRAIERLAICWPWGGEKWPSQRQSGALGFDRPEARSEDLAYLVQAVRAAGKCDAVFKGFSDCLLKLGDSMANYPQGLDDKTNIKTVCTYWEDFHSCTVTALTDCQEGAKDMWDKLRKESKNLNIQGSLFELCGSGNGAAGSLLPALPVLLVSLSAALATWLSF